MSLIPVLWYQANNSKIFKNIPKWRDWQIRWNSSSRVECWEDRTWILWLCRRCWLLWI